MNSKIFKRPYSKVEITDHSISGNMLFRKIESWLEAEPSVLIWETSYYEPPAMQGFDSQKREIAVPRYGWTIEFQFDRANAAAKDGYYDGVAIIAGTITHSLEIAGEKSREAYKLSCSSRNFRGEATFTSAVELWKTFTNLGLRKTTTP
ncbi:MAG: hypothetical protein Q7K65_03650 [Candidatus Buchananbacteria bacterium]|nr:hypothetical protein [Candidatus Buchananbacteria bacterium]